MYVSINALSLSLSLSLSTCVLCNLSLSLSTNRSLDHRLKARLLSLVKTGRLEWSTLTRTRRADVMVGLTLQCLLMSLPVLVASVARACRVVVVTLYALTVRLATLFGVVRPLRLVKDVSGDTTRHWAHSSQRERDCVCVRVCQCVRVCVGVCGWVCVWW